MRRPLCQFRPGGARLAAVLVLAAVAAPSPARGEERVQVERLRAELALARSGGFYLRLEPAGRTLGLVLNGVVLERFPALAIERGTTRVAFRSRPALDGWDRRGYAGGRLEPARERDRLEITAPSEGDAPVAPPLPPTAEESVSVPERWRVVFAEGLILEVTSEGGARNRSALRRAADAWRLFWADRASALAPQTRERVWLRLRLSAGDAAALYRSLPPEVGFVIADGRSR